MDSMRELPDLRREWRQFSKDERNMISNITSTYLNNQIVEQVLTSYLKIGGIINSVILTMLAWTPVELIQVFGINVNLGMTVASADQVFGIMTTGLASHRKDELLQVWGKCRERWEGRELACLESLVMAWRCYNVVPCYMSIRSINWTLRVLPIYRMGKMLE